MSESVREAMIEAAWLLIAERGLEGMSTREVLARTGAPRGSVYHHFPRGRAELIELAIDHSISWMGKEIDAIDPKSPDDVIAGYLDIWRRVLEGTDFRAGCAAAGVINGGHDPQARELGATAFAKSEDALSHLFQEVGVPLPEADSRAMLLVCAAEGAVILARAQRNTKPLNIIAEQLARWA